MLDSEQVRDAKISAGSTQEVETEDVGSSERLAREVPIGKRTEALRDRFGRKADGSRS